MSTVEQLMTEALKLPADERERLTEELVKSIQADDAELSQHGYRDAWKSELAQRIADADRGEFSEGDWRDVVARVRQDLEK